MQRDIEFRVYDKDLKKMRYLNTSHDFICFNEDGSAYYHNMQTGLGEWFSELMQYTGLKDKNGRKIFEGDIVEYKDTDFPGRNETGNVIYTKDCKFEIEYYSDILKHKDTMPLVFFEHPIFTSKKLEVIGNIYENNLESEEN